MNIAPKYRSRSTLTAELQWVLDGLSWSKLWGLSWEVQQGPASDGGLLLIEWSHILLWAADNLCPMQLQKITLLMIAEQNDWASTQESDPNMYKPSWYKWDLNFPPSLLHRKKAKLWQELWFKFCSYISLIFLLSLSLSQFDIAVRCCCFQWGQMPMSMNANIGLLLSTPFGD